MAGFIDDPYPHHTLGPILQSVANMSHTFRGPITQKTSSNPRSTRSFWEAFYYIVLFQQVSVIGDMLEFYVLKYI